MGKLAITRANGVATVFINNPPVNILSIDLISEINEFLESLKGDKDTRIVIFKSANDSFFICHLDLNLINGIPEGQFGCLEFSRMINSLKNLDQLSIAVVDGIARGGGDEFVLACDLAYGTENGAFAQPELCVNIPAGGQGAVQYARRMGKGKAMQALITGADFTAEEAEAANVITKFVPKADMETFIAGLIAATANLDVRDFVMYKKIIDASLKDESAGIELELRYFLDRAKEAKTQAIFSAFLKCGGQTEREATDFPGLFEDTAKELGL